MRVSQLCVKAVEHTTKHAQAAANQAADHMTFTVGGTTIETITSFHYLGFPITIVKGNSLCTLLISSACYKQIVYRYDVHVFDYFGVINECNNDHRITIC